MPEQEKTPSTVAVIESEGRALHVELVVQGKHDAKSIAEMIKRVFTKAVDDNVERALVTEEDGSFYIDLYPNDGDDDDEDSCIITLVIHLDRVESDNVKVEKYHW